MKSKKVNSLTILTLLLLLIVVGGCGINPLTPSLNELKKSLNYFPLNQYSSWNYETDNGDTLILTVTDTFYSEGNKIYTSKEFSAVCVSAMTGADLLPAIEISKEYKKFTNAKIIWGGHHASALPEETLKEPYIDRLKKAIQSAVDSQDISTNEQR